MSPTAAAGGNRRTRVLVVGSGWRFTSGISYYTCRLANAFAERTPTSVVLMRRLVPRALYPGRSRVGSVVNDIDYSPGIDVFDGVDWYWGPSTRGLPTFLRRTSPDVVVLQWWTGAVLHSYLLLTQLVRRRGAKVVVEWHEVQDTGEARVPGVVRYVRSAMKTMLRRVDAHVVHSEYDSELLQGAYGLDPESITVIPHGPYDHVLDTTAERTGTSTAQTPLRLLFFGTIRPYKGLEDLVEAFSSLPREVAEEFRLTIVGETWEGWTGPLDAVRDSPHRDRIDLVNRYVTDAEVRTHFAAADAVVLPYRRSSSSGPLQMAMSAGLPTVVTAVGGLVEAAREYEGAVFVPPASPRELADALRGLLERRGVRYADPHSWDTSVSRFARVFRELGVPGTLDEPGGNRVTSHEQSDRHAEVTRDVVA
ncbi:glycosyltransferase [Kineococcus rhizosphaerae]|uniref:Glycosyltransferase involved in cell wall biosynthesis n=1 Tax=Kineococcus rhizosphaerae TaxID=559628 RepID=A0A2T0R5I3_9ACTN|nr:glycosyltransferase [Kineococcus rhizosphaerae]PRY15977.1 glycosyltransferase involved in cell wall biosynthesis [Kineococcus rhizosphaerae]